MNKFHKSVLQTDKHRSDCFVVHAISSDIVLTCTICGEGFWYFNHSRPTNKRHFNLVEDYYYFIPCLHRECRDIFELTPESYV